MTLVSLTDYDKSSKYLIRDNLLMEFNELIEAQEKCIVIRGEEFIGKTTFIEQLIENSPEQAIYYIVKEDIYRDTLEYILKELTEQMMFKLDISHINNDIDNLTLQEVMLKFQQYYARLCKKVEREKKKFYLIIDGLEKLTEEVYESLLSIIPTGEKKGFHIVLSISKNFTKSINRQYKEIEVKRFSINDTRSLFKAYNDYENKIEQIHQFCRGLPAYIFEFYRNIELNPDLLNSEDLTEYGDFNSRFNTLWERYCFSDNEKKILSIIVFAQEAFTFEELTDLSPDGNLDFLRTISFITIEDDKITYPPIYKNRLQELLSEFKSLVNEHLIQFYTHKTETLKNLSLLSNLIVETKDYDKLKTILSTKVLVPYLKNITGTELIRDNLNLLEYLSLENKDFDFYINSTLSKNILNEVIQSPSTLKNDIETLLSIKEYEEAIVLAKLCTIPEDRCLFISIICKKLKKENMDIPKTLLDLIENGIMTSTNIQNFSKEVLNKWLAISANIFPINADLALRIIEFISNQNNSDLNKEKLMDYLLLNLFISSEGDLDEDESFLGNINQIISTSENENFRDIYYLSTISHNFTSTEILEKVEQMQDDSAKIFYIRNWLLNNKSNHEVISVINYLLDKMQVDMNFTLTFKDFYIIVDVINSLKVNSDKTQEIITNLENYELGMTKSPEKEYLRFKFNVIRYYKNNTDSNILVLYQQLLNYIENEINLIDIKFYAMANLYKETSKIGPYISFNNDIRVKLDDYFLSLTTETALESEIVNEAIGDLAIIDLETALTYRSLLNTENTRVKASLTIINKIIDYNSLSISCLNNILSFTNKGHIDYLIHQTTKYLNKKNYILTKDILDYLMDFAKNIDSSSMRVLSVSNLAYALNINSEEFKENIILIIDSLNNIDSFSHKRNIRNIVMQNIGEISEEENKKIYNHTEINSVKFMDQRLQKLDFHIVTLMIKMIPDLLNNEGIDFYIRQILNSIESFDSVFNKGILYNLLGLKLFTKKRLDLINLFKSHYINLFHQKHNDSTMHFDLLENGGVLLYLLDKDEYMNIWKNNSYVEYRDDSIIEIIKYNISDRGYLEKVNLEQVNTKIDSNCLFEIIELLNLIKRDYKIFGVLKMLIPAIERSVNSTTFTLREGTIPEVVNELTKLINRALPDSENIQHIGYKIACFSEIASLRKISKLKKGTLSILPLYDDLYSQIVKIDNLSDRIFVLCQFAINSKDIDIKLSTNFITEAENLLFSLTNYSDKIERAETVIETHHELGNQAAAEHLLANIFDIIKIHKNSYDFEENVSDLIEIAHKINPELATQLSKSIDSPNQQIQVRNTLKVLDLHYNPNRISEETSINLATLKEFLSKTLVSLHSLRVASYTNDIFIRFYTKTKKVDLEAVLLLIDVIIENTIKSNGEAKISKLGNLFSLLLDNRSFSSELDNAMFNTEKLISNIQNYGSFTSDGISSIYKKGQGSLAKKRITDWVNENSNELLMIYDPYFSEDDLELFINIKKDITSMVIITSADNSSTQNTRDEFKSIYSKKWASICDQASPEIDFYVLCSHRRKNNMHDRFIICDSVGLKYGVSFNGMNSNDFTMEELTTVDSENIKNSILIPTIYSPKSGEVESNPITLIKFQL